MNLGSGSEAGRLITRENDMTGVRLLERGGNHSERSSPGRCVELVMCRGRDPSELRYQCGGLIARDRVALDCFVELESDTEIMGSGVETKELEAPVHEQRSFS